MKKYIFLAVSAFYCSSVCAQQDTFTIDGKIKGKTEGYLYINYADKEGVPKKDSASIQNGGFKFTGKITEPTSLFLTGDPAIRNMDDPNLATVFIEPTSMQLELVYGDFKHFALTGSKMQDDFNKLNLQKAPIEKELQPYYKALSDANAAYIKAKKEKRPDSEVDLLHKKANDIRNQLAPFGERMDKIDYAFFMKNPDSYVPAYLMLFKVSGLPLDSVLLFYNNMTERVKNSNFGKRIADEVVKLKKGIPGAVAENFDVPDINGNRLSLASLKGKYVLLDFWASWCVPCREGKPHLKQLYAKYKDKGLEIVGIADDDSTVDAWKKAVDQDGTAIWRHILRGLKRTATGFDRTNDISEGFGIHTLPTKILVDKEGIIIGRYGGGGESDEAMDKKLAELMSK